MSFHNSDEKQTTEEFEAKCVITLSRPNNIQEPTSDTLCLSVRL